jgi:hypothetical protein
MYFHGEIAIPGLEIEAQKDEIDRLNLISAANKFRSEEKALF